MSLQRFFFKFSKNILSKLVLIFLLLTLISKILHHKEIENDCLSAFDSNFDFKPNKNFSKHPSCSEDWLTIDQYGTVLFKEKFKIKNCSYATVEWFVNDFKFKLSEFKEIKNNSQLDINQEFFHIKCFSKDQKYYFGFPKIFHSAPKPEEDNINVFFYLMDSISRDEWLEKLPKSSEYLIKTLKSRILSRYNIVGDGTPAALIPLLTSKHENELPSTVKENKNSSFVDEAYPFIWKEFKQELGYKTLFAEDMAQIGTFQYRLVGMRNPPTDHYTRF